jgi:non-specific serine/threonine protein kinase/serine/threonine-protein kinase
MDPDRWQRMNDLFHAAVERDSRERAAYLAEACAGDGSLLADLQRLVHAHERAAAIIGTSVFEHTSGRPAGLDEPSAVGRQLGPYKIVREIGRGGMGTVYLAERADHQYAKRVAIKLIKRGMDTDAVVRQFRQERQILANLEHPNIGGLLDGGTTDDHLPYFVMEYVEGMPISEYCETQRLPINDRVRLFRQVCAAVSYAHQHLVVHRDLKPSNIVVTSAGTPKLLDFGIAKVMHPGATGETSPTFASLRLMTPDYASPEQVHGLPATTLSDVYSLGVVLYELLSGRPPYRFQTRSIQEVAQTLATVEPDKPSQAVIRRVDSARLRGDLDNIVLKAMDKERERRYQSVDQLSDDLERHLHGLPVAARKDTLRDRAAKFVRRNKVAVAAGALVFLTLVAGIAATTWQAHRARAQEAIAKAEQARAERRFNDVRQLARSVLFDYHDAIKDLPGATPVRARLVRDGLAYLDGLAKEAQNDRVLQRELASAYARVGDVQGGTMFANLGDTAGALESYRKALQLHEALAATDPQDPQTRRDLAVTQRKLGLLLWETGDISGALAIHRRTLALWQSLVAEESTNHDLRSELAHTYDYLGMMLQESGDYAGALEHYRQGRDIWDSLAALDPTSPASRRALSVVYEHMGALLLVTGDLENALANNRRALELRAALAAEFPLNADHRRTLAVSYYNAGEILSKMGRTGEALESYRQNLARIEALLAQDPENEQYRGDVAYSLIRVGDMLAVQGRPREALARYGRSLTMRERDVTADPTNLWKRSSLIEAHAKITKTLAKANQRAAALEATAKTLALMDKTRVESTNVVIRGFFADTYADLGQAHAVLAAGRRIPDDDRPEHWRRSRDLYRRSLAIWEDLRGRGTLSAIDRPKLETVEREIARCDRMVAAAMQAR